MILKSHPHRWSVLIASISMAASLILVLNNDRRVRAEDEKTVESKAISDVANENDVEILSPSWRLHQLVHPAHRQQIWHLAFSPNSETIASAADDNVVRLWDVPTGRLMGLIERPINCRCVAFSPDGSHLAIAGGESGTDPVGELVIWNLARREPEHVLLTPPNSKYVRWTAYSGNGKWLASGGTDRIVRIWDVSTGKLYRSLNGHTALVASVAFSPNNKHLASASFDRTIRVWDVDSGDLLSVIEGHDAEIRFVSYSPDGDYLLSTSDDKTARLWNAKTFEQLTVMDNHDGPVFSGAFAPNSVEFVTAGKIGGARNVLLRTAPEGNWRDSRLFPDQVWDILSVTFSPDGNMLAIAGGFGSFQIWKRN